MAARKRQISPYVLEIRLQALRADRARMGQTGGGHQWVRLTQKSTTSLKANFQGEAGKSSKASRAIAP